MLLSINNSLIVSLSLETKKCILSVALLDFPYKMKHNNKGGWLGHNKKNRIIECETSRVTEPGTDNLEEQNRTLRRLI